MMTRTKALWTLISGLWAQRQQGFRVYKWFVLSRCFSTLFVFDDLGCFVV